MLAFTATLSITTIISCSKNNQEIATKDEKQSSVITTSATSPPSSHVLYSNAVNSLSSINARRIFSYDGSGDVIPAGASRVEYYQVTGEDNIYRLIVWKKSSDSGYDEARTNCIMAWHGDNSEGEDVGCFGDGNTCDVEGTTLKKVTVVCCDE